MGKCKECNHYNPDQPCQFENGVCPYQYPNRNLANKITDEFNVIFCVAGYTRDEIVQRVEKVLENEK